MTTTTAVPSKLTLVNCNEFRKGNYLASLGKYSEQWNSYLPYHVDAFPKDHPLRPKFGEAEACLFNSMSACLTKLGNRSLKRGKIQQGSLIIEQAFRCIWVAMDLREFATVRSIYSSCRRACDLIDQLYLGKSLMKHCSPKLYKHLVSAGLRRGRRS